jgi:uroporphyrinogen III methyltransferase/synthase
VIVIIGAVSALGQEFNWFDALPLRGQGVWLTRPEDQNNQLASRLRELGAEVFEQPMLTIEPTADPERLRAALERMAQGHVFGIAFTSRHAVEAVMRMLLSAGSDARVMHGVKLACVGDKTAAALAEFGLRPDLVPTENFNAESLLAEIVRHDWASGKSWLLPQANQARDTLEAGLRAAGARVERVEAYRSIPAARLAPELLSAVQRGAIDWVTVTSPSIARTLRELLGEHASRVKPLSLSPAITRVLAEVGWPAGAQAAEATEEALLNALLAGL